MSDGGIGIAEVLLQSVSIRDDTYASILGQKDAEKFCRRPPESRARRAMTDGRRQDQSDEAAAEAVGRGICP